MLLGHQDMVFTLEADGVPVCGLQNGVTPKSPEISHFWNSFQFFEPYGFGPMFGPILQSSFGGSPCSEYPHF